MERKPNTLLVVTSGLLTVALVFLYLTLTRAADRRWLASQAAAVKNSIGVAAAARDLPARTLIRPEDITWRYVPRAYLPPDAARGIKQVVGKETISDIYAGEAVSVRRLKSDPSRRPSTLIRPGKVALAVGADEVAGVAGGIRAGDLVDVLVTDEENHRTRRLLSKVRVLGTAGAYPFRQTGDGSDIAPTSSAVVLETSPEQAKQLTQASETGKLRLALRAAR